MLNVAFLQLSRESAVEYDSVSSFVCELAKDRLNPLYVRQIDTKNSRLAGVNPGATHTLLLDFGRDLSSTRVTRVQRMLKMLFAMPGSLIKTTAFLLKHKPDMIFTTSQKEDVFFGFLFSLLLRKPQVISVHYPAGPALGKFTMDRLKSCKHIITNSQFTKRTTIAAGASADKVESCYPSRRLSNWQDAQKEPSIKSEFGLPFDAKLVLAVGRLDPEKGLDNLIKAFNLLSKKQSDAYLVICGATNTKDNYDKYLVDLAASQGVSDRVIFAGKRRDMHRFYSEASIFCLPTVNEAFGIVFLEAMFSSLPIVALQSGATAEIVLHGQTGLLCEEGNIQQLSDSLSTLLSDSRLCSEFGKKARERYLDTFVPTVAAEKWMTTLEHWFADNHESEPSHQDALA